MWKFNRNLKISRWFAFKRKKFENEVNPLISKNLSILQNPDLNKSDKKNEKRHNKSKESEKFWNHQHFQYLLWKSSLLETAGWLGTVTILCFNFHYKHFSAFYDNARAQHRCLFSRSALAMPKIDKKQPNRELIEESTVQEIPSTHSSVLQRNSASAPSDDKVSVLSEIRQVSLQYSAIAQNSAGMSHLDKNDRKAFRHFQEAARLGSSQGYYNLGLCYELGKGTKPNLNMAAFCYRKAATKGHALASFNLAVYLMKGMGGLAVDRDSAKRFLEQAAEKNVSEAQLYLGLECLEEDNYPKALEIFNKLSEKNNLHGKYYLGLCYENGWGVEKNIEAALNLYSEAATSGHAKSILQICKCYEEGTGGCEKDLGFATSLCQILADQGDEEGIKTYNRLLQKIKNQNDVPARSIMHTSSSLPTLPVKETPGPKSIGGILISSYLDLVINLLPKKSTSSLEPTSFYIGDEKPVLVSAGTHKPYVQTMTVPHVAAAT